MATGMASMTSAKYQNKGDVVVWAITFAVGLYLLSALFGLPEYLTSLANGSHHELQAAANSADGHASPGHGDSHAAAVQAPPYWMVIPFVLLLGAIAVLPLLESTEHWWDSNLNRFKVAVTLAAVTLGYYALLHQGAIESHWPAHQVMAPTSGAVQTSFVGVIFGNAILAEYIPFIVLLFSLYVITGGIRIEGDLEANPLTNASFMAVGGLLASFIGTTGAAMLLIRPLLDTNKERKHVSHTVIFFIFIVCNCGGCLLPIGDPPLFLGYLEGVHFTWTLGLWEPWLFVNGLLLIVYCLADQFFFYRTESIKDIERDVRQTRRLKISGLALNGPLVLGIVLAVALLDPKKPIPGTHWHAWMYLREMAQLGLVALSLHFGSRALRQKNSFNYHAIVEVAALFIGIFICMQPALQILSIKGAALVDKFHIGPTGFFWMTGALSSFLDNAPTYLVFFKTAQDPTLAGPTGGVPATILVAISLGAVFMGSMTYIGNGPNFMVKAIAEKSGVKMPSFFGYMVYSGFILLPILLLAQWQFASRSANPPPANGPAAQQISTEAPATHPVDSIAPGYSAA